MSDTVILGVVASPKAGGNTATAVAAVLAGAATCGAVTESVELATTPVSEVVSRIADADGVVFASPVHRAGYTAQLRLLLEHVERGFHGERQAPLRGKAVGIVMTGASSQHFLATDSLRAVLATFFAAQTLSPALYLDRTAFTEQKTLVVASRTLAHRHGVALVDLTRAVRQSPSLRTMEPLA